MGIVILQGTLNYLRFNLIWPRKGQELNPGKTYYLKFILMLAFASQVLIGSTLHLIVSISNNSRNISEDLVIIIAEIGVYYFNSIFVYHQKEIAAIYEHFSDFRKLAKPQNFDKRNERLVQLSKFYRLFIDLALLNFCVSPLILEGFCEKKNRFREFKEVCGMVCTTWMPFDISRFPIKQIFYIWQCFCVVSSLKGAAAISFAIMETMEHLILRIQQVKFLMNRAINTEDSDLREKLFLDAVKYHLSIFEMSRIMDRCYTGCLFLHVLLTGALFGCIGYNFMDNFSMNSLSLLFGWFLSVYIVSVGGQRVMEEGLSVVDTVYGSNWYDRDVNFQKRLISVIQRAQKPITLSAGPFTHVSHVTILNIFKTAYSYMTLLNATSK